jgi:hypothetical protein
VLRYNEDWGDDYNSPAKVVGRMNMPLWVMYYDKSMEITGTVAQLVNSKFGAAAAAAPAGGGVVPVNGPGK